MSSRVAIAGAFNGRDELRAWLRALLSLNVELLRLARRAGRPYPPLYRSGVRYAPEPRAGSAARAALEPEDFAPVPVVISRGWGDCDDLAAWRAAEWQLSGVLADIDVRESAGSSPTARRWHIVVVLPDGSIEDPSRRLSESVQ